MRPINIKQYRDQTRRHYNHVSKCSDHHNDVKVINTGNGSCNCPDYNDQISEILGDITEINTNIQSINTKIEDIEIRLAKLEAASTQEETVALSVALPHAVIPSTDTDSTVTTAIRNRGDVTPNTTAFDSLLADVENMSEGDLDEYYLNNIDPILKKTYKDDNNLLNPIPVSAINDVKIPDPDIVTKDSITWAELTDGKYVENKRAYIMQFILANRSNQTRALYLSNALMNGFTLPL